MPLWVLLGSLKHPLPHTSNRSSALHRWSIYAQTHIWVFGITLELRIEATPLGYSLHTERCCCCSFPCMHIEFEFNLDPAAAAKGFIFQQLKWLKQGKTLPTGHFCLLSDVQTTSQIQLWLEGTPGSIATSYSIHGIADCSEGSYVP